MSGQGGRADDAGTGSGVGQGAREIRDESGGRDDGVRVDIMPSNVLTTDVVASNGLARDVVGSDGLATEIRDESGGGDNSMRADLATDEMASNGEARDVVAKDDDDTMGLVARGDGAQNDGVGGVGA